MKRYTDPHNVGFEEIRTSREWPSYTDVAAVFNDVDMISFNTLASFAQAIAGFDQEVLLKGQFA